MATRKSQMDALLAQRQEVADNIAQLPVVLCESHVYPGMRIIMTVDTRQLKDLVHILTRNPGESRNFVAVRKITDMRGFVLNLKQVFRST